MCQVAQPLHSSLQGTRSLERRAVSSQESAAQTDKANSFRWSTLGTTRAKLPCGEGGELQGLMLCDQLLGSSHGVSWLRVPGQG